MVLTITLNPLLENKYFFRDISHNNSRAYNQEYLAGGKGINVSRQLNLLGVKNHALLFLGGPNGKKLRAALEKDNINFTSISTKAETREASLIFDERQQKLQTFFGVNSAISKLEIEQFIAKLEKAITNSSIVIFSGSIPDKKCSKIIKRGIEFCNKHDKISIIDTYGEFLEEYIQLGPTIVHNNKTEVSTSLEMDLNNISEIRSYLDYLYDNNVKLSFLTSGSEPSFAAKSNFHYKILNPNIMEKDSTGSGDAFMSGIIYGLEKSLVFNEFIRLASSLGALNASSWDVCRVRKEEMRYIADQVHIEEIGKKIKLIDDSPTIY